MRAPFVAMLGAALVGCSTPPGIDVVETRSAPIVGGQEAPPCAFPTTVAYRSRMASCTATLVHKKMITVAKHCIEGDTPIEILFGDTPLMASRRVGIASCKGADQFDFAYCILAQEVADVPIVPILYGCEKQIITIGAKVVLVGFGLIGANTPSPGSQKRWVEVEVAEILPTSLVVGDTTHGACFGDSGGPAYVKLPDGSWRVWGVTHGGLEGDLCATKSDYMYTPSFVPWIEEQSGLDVTPCYEANGVWNPGPECTGFPMNPEVSDGTWANMCTENLVLSGPSAACGDAIDAGMSTIDAGIQGAGGANQTVYASNVDGGCSCRIADAPRNRRSLSFVLSPALIALIGLSALRRWPRATRRLAGSPPSPT